MTQIKLRFICQLTNGQLKGFVLNVTTTHRYFPHCYVKYAIQQIDRTKIFKAKQPATICDLENYSDM